MAKAKQLCRMSRFHRSRHAFLINCSLWDYRHLEAGGNVYTFQKAAIRAILGSDHPELPLYIFIQGRQKI